MENNIGALTRLFCIFNHESAVCGRFPFDGLCVFHSGFSGNNGYLVRNHERCVEPHAELAYELGVFLYVLFLQKFEEISGPRMCDSPEGLDRLVLCHADAIVADSQGTRILVGFNLYLPFLVAFKHVTVGQGFVARLIDSIRCVRNQLAQKYFLVRIERMNHKIKQLLDLSLEIHFLCCHIVYTSHLINFLRFTRQ